MCRVYNCRPPELAELDFEETQVHIALLNTEYEHNQMNRPRSRK
jgi:hypothetical protein